MHFHITNILCYPDCFSYPEITFFDFAFHPINRIGCCVTFFMLDEITTIFTRYRALLFLRFKNLLNIVNAIWLTTVLNQNIRSLIEQWVTVNYNVVVNSGIIWTLPDTDKEILFCVLLNDDPGNKIILKIEICKSDIWKDNSTDTWIYLDSPRAVPERNRIHRPQFLDRDELVRRAH